MRFPKRVNWKRARHNLMIEDETKAIRISTLRYNWSIRQFVEDTQNDIEKEGDVFGEKIDYGMKNSLKRVYADIHNEEAYDKKKAMLITADPRRFVYSYPAIRSYLKHESKTRKSVFVPDKIDYDPQPWIVPQVMTDYVNEYIHGGCQGRRKSLILVGKSRTGKTQWAESHGKYI
jgi:hypothetical protein